MGVVLMKMGVAFRILHALCSFVSTTDDDKHLPKLGCPTEKVKVCKMNSSQCFRVDPS